MKYNKNEGGPSTIFFVIISLFYLLWLGYGAHFYWSKLIVFELKEWGDLLAGVFSPLAFFWLLFAALAQREELKLQRQELQQTREELKRSADAQEKTEAAMRNQTSAQLRPLLKATVTERFGAWALIITNEGRSAAVDVKANCDVDFALARLDSKGPIERLSQVPLFSVGGLTIPPGTQLRYEFPESNAKDNDEYDVPLLPRSFSITIKYSYAGDRYEDVLFVSRDLAVGTTVGPYIDESSNRISRSIREVAAEIKSVSGKIRR